MAAYVALLHSVVLTPQRRVVMSDLRAMAGEMGLAAPRTLASTGNLVFETSAASVHSLEDRLETAFRMRFGKHVDILVREARSWGATAAANPFSEASERDGSLVLLRVMRTPLPAEASGILEPYRAPAELLQIVNGDLWVSFHDRPSQSRLLGALSTRRLGAGTLRNWNTVRGLAEMLG